MSKDEKVTIRVEVRRGKEILFQAVVPEDTGLTYEFPGRIEVAPGHVLASIVVSPTVTYDPSVVSRNAANARVARDLGIFDGTVTSIERKGRS